MGERQSHIKLLKLRIISIGIITLLVLGGFIFINDLGSEYSTVQAAELYVGGSGSGNYSTIQAAIDNATSGDTIYVYNGTYYENVVVDKTVTLIGNGSANTTIDGGGGRVVKIEADLVNMSGFYITRSGNNRGIFVESSFNTIFNNTINSSFYGGLVLSYTNNNTLYNNTFILCGIGFNGNSVTDFTSHEINISNTVNDNPVYYWKNINGGTIPAGAGQVLLMNCENVTVSNQNLSNATVGVQMVYSNSNTFENNNCNYNSAGMYIIRSSYNDFLNNTYSNCDNGLHLDDSDNNLFNNNTFNSTFDNGIYIHGLNCYNNTFSNNSFNSNPDYGIYSFSNAHHNKFFNNNCSDNYIGIYITTSSNNIITNNTCNDNDEAGIKIYSSPNSILNNNTCNLNGNYGIFVASSYDTIENNTCINNTDGIHLQLSSFNTIANNTCNLSKDTGIYLNGSSDNVIENNTCNDNDEYGIYVYGYYIDCLNNKFFNNTCNSNFCGISLYNGCNDSIISNNTVNYNDYGISVNGAPKQCFYNKILNNTCKLNTDSGIALYQAPSTTFKNNTLDSNGLHGILMNYGGNSVLRNNSFINCGLWTAEDYDIDTSNTVNNKPIYYWYGVVGNTVPSDAGQVVLSYSENIIVENLMLTNGGAGVLVHLGKNNIIRNNSCFNMTIAGIYIAGSDNKIINNNCSFNYDGIKQSSEINNTIENNICNNNSNQGIYYSGTEGKIRNNTCNYNTEHGLSLTSATYSFISNNTCNGNEKGINLNSHNNTIVNNTCKNNYNGIYLSSAKDNLVYHNNLIANTVNAFDNDGNNTWNASYIDGGNYWSDYLGSDIYHGPGQNLTGSDGIGDTPYTNIAGGSGAKDHYPFIVTDDWMRVYNQDKNSWHVSIQGAIDNASSGDSIWARSGIYYENIVIDKTITLTGQDRDTTIIMANGTGDVVNITADWVNVSGFTVNGAGNGIHDAGIELRNNNNNMISNNNVSNNPNMGIYVTVSSDNIISNNSCFNNSRGIVITSSDGNTVENNTCNSNSNRGIEIYNNWGGNNMVINNKCFNNTIGVRVSASYDTLVLKNICNANSNVGIELYTSSYNNTISNNTCNKNSVYGIYLHSSPHNNTISNNIINNNQKGIFMTDSNDNTIRNNIINSNSQFGINLTSSYSNTIYHNNFINNSIHAQDKSANFWNLSSPGGGNYFDNWTTPDMDQDGFVDSPFNISGGINKDYLPLAHPYGSVQNLDTGEIFYTIQTAINDSDTLAGHTIYVKNDTYYENIIIGKSVKLEGEDRDATIINGSGIGAVVYVSADWVNVFEFKITGSGNAGDDSGIQLDGVENCSIINNNLSSNYKYGLFIKYNSKNNIINNNTCNFNYHGIYVQDSTNNFVFNNTCISNDMNGIYLQGSHENIIEKNICNLNFETGIYLLTKSSNNVIKNNNCSDNQYGVTLLSDGGDFNFITNNILFSNSNSGIRIEAANDYNSIIENEIIANNWGLYLRNPSYNNTIYHNNFIGNSLHAEDDGSNFWNESYPEGGNFYDNWTSPDNNKDGFVDNPFNIASGTNYDYWPFTTISGWTKHVHNLDKNTWHLTIQEGLDLADAGDTIFVESGTFYGNIIINKTITLIGDDRNTTKIIGNGTGDVVYITADWVNVSGFTITGSGNTWLNAGIMLYQNQNCLIVDIIASNNSGNGIYLTSGNNILEGNKFTFNNGSGIRGTSYYGVIINNTFYSNNGNGMWLSSGSNNNIVNNICNLNTKHGLNLEGTSNNTISNNILNSNNADGIYLGALSDDNIITNNSFILNRNGIHIEINSKNNTIVNNTIDSNNDCGIYVHSSSIDNTIYHNNFINNANHAFDNCNNSWNGTSGIWGNFYDNWTLPDADHDGIVDNPFNISGGINKDYYPLAHPYGSVQNLDTGEIFFTIQTAINDSDTLAGHTIYVKNHTYYENIYIGKSISLVGEDREGTMINGSRKGDVIRVKADFVNIRGFNITGSGIDYVGIDLDLVNYCNISNVNCLNNYYGIGIRGPAEYNNVENNICFENIYHGIYVNAQNNVIKNNICYSNLHGIVLVSGADGQKVINNTCYSNTEMGIELNSAHFNTIENNNCILNGGTGIRVYWNSWNNTVNNNNCSNNFRGISLQEGLNLENNIVKNNICNSNIEYGLYLHYAFNNTIINNNVSNNGLGIDLMSSNNNTIYHNNFIGNTNHAYDDGTNYWNLSYPGGGNYFDNWTTPDNNADGFVDNPFIIAGGTNKDYWPYTTIDGWKRPVHNLDKNTWHLTIQEGVDLADAGDTIFVGNGIYYENVIINKTVTLVGEDRNTTVINGSYVGDVVFINANWVNVSGFSIINSGSSILDAGIKLNNSHNCQIENNSAMNNNFGIYLYYSSSNDLKNNICNFNENAGIYLYSSVLNEIDNNICLNNSEGNIPGIMLRFSVTNTITNNNCSNNFLGISVETKSNDNTIANNTCINNINGIYLFNDCRKNKLVNNTCNSNTGYGITLSLDSKDNTLINNICLKNNKGIQLLSNSKGNKIVNCTFISNSNYDIYIASESNNTAINTSFYTIFIDSTSELIIKNYLHLRVNDSYANPVLGADLQVKDGNTIIYATSGYGGTNLKTDANGQLKWILVTDRIYVGSTTPTENITTVTVSYPGLTFRDNARDINMSTSHYEYFIANALPSKITLDTPANNAYLNDKTPELKWNTGTDLENDLLSYYIEVDEYGSDWGSLVASSQTSTGVLSWSIPTSLNEAQSYQWRVRAFDGYDNGSWSTIRKFTIDTKPPSSPTDVTATPAFWTNTNSFTINWTIPSDTSGIKIGAWYKIGSPPTTSTDGTWVSTKPITDIKAPTEGTHIIYIWLKDNLSHINHLNYGTTKLYYDATPPSAPSINSLTHPEDTWTANNNPFFNWSEPVELSGVAGYSYVLDQAPTTLPGTTPTGNSTNALFTNIADGVWYFHLRAYDLAGNWGPAAHYKLRLDVNGPSAAGATITIDGGAAYSNDLILNIEWSNFNDIDGSGIAGYYYSFTDNSGTADGTWTDTMAGILTATDEGTPPVYVWAKDNVGNIGPAAAASITIKFPLVSDLELSTETLYRTQTITFTSNCTELIDLESELDCDFQYKSEDGSWQPLIATYKNALGGYWQAKYTPPIDNELGTYYVRVMYTNLNGTYTNWTTRTFNVQNNPPTVLNPLDDFDILEDQSDYTTVNLNLVFYDPDSSTLEFGVAGNFHIAVTINPDGSVTFVPEANWTGSELIKFSANDNVAPLVIEEVMVTILPVNDIPLAFIDTDVRNAVLGQNLTIAGHGSDVDGIITEYNWSSNLDGMLGTTSSFNTSILSHGTHKITFMVKDSENLWSEPVKIDVMVTAPDLSVQDLKLSSEDITEGDKITLTATINNDGDANATNITVTFYDGDKQIGTKEIEVIVAHSQSEASITWEPSVGDHSLRVVVTAEDEEISELDNENNQLSKSINVKMDWTPWIIFILVIIIIIISLIAILMFYRARKLRKQDMMSISNIESKLSKTKEKGLAIGDLEKLLGAAKELRDVGEVEPIKKKDALIPKKGMLKKEFKK